MIRCSTVAKMARSTGNSNRRSASRSSITARQPVSSHSPEQQRRADALAGKPRGVAGLDLRENHGPLGITGDRAGQALEGAGGGNGLLAAEVLDDALLGAAVLAHGLDEVEVGVAVDALLADEHAKLATDLAIVRQGKTTRLLQNLASQLFAAAVPA